MTAKSEVLKAFIRDVNERPDDLIPGPYTIEDNKTKREWWIGIGGFGLWRPTEIKVGFFRGFIARYYVNKIKSHHAKRMTAPLEK